MYQIIYGLIFGVKSNYVFICDRSLIRNQKSASLKSIDSKVELFKFDCSKFFQILFWRGVFQRKY